MRRSVSGEHATPTTPPSIPWSYTKKNLTPSRCCYTLETQKKGGVMWWTRCVLGEGVTLVPLFVHAEKVLSIVQPMYIHSAQLFSPTVDHWPSESSSLHSTTPYGSRLKLEELWECPVPLRGQTSPHRRQLLTQLIADITILGQNFP